MSSLMNSFVTLRRKKYILASQLLILALSMETDSPLNPIIKRFTMNYFLKLALRSIAPLLIFNVALHSSQPKKRLLIVGCAASGTHYIAQVLEKSGLHVGHEKLGDDGLVSWTMVGNRIGYAEPKEIEDPKSHFEHIFHQIRDPLRVIRNRYSPNTNKNLDSVSWTFNRKVIPEMHRDDPLLVHCAKYYYYWNLKAEEMAEFSYRIEDFESALPEFEHRLGFRIDRKALSQQSKKTHTWEKWNPGNYIDITWELLEKELPSDLYSNLRALAQRYGYLK